MPSITFEEPGSTFSDEDRRSMMYVLPSLAAMSRAAAGLTSPEYPRKLPKTNPRILGPCRQVRHTTWPSESFACCMSKLCLLHGQQETMVVGLLSGLTELKFTLRWSKHGCGTLMMTSSHM